MFDRVYSFLSSLKLTVVCLALATALVFIGTLAQVHEGLYSAQQRYFRSLFVYWNLPGTPVHVPIFPGGYLVGGVLLVNLIASHARTLRLSRSKTGSMLTHGGIVLLLLGQFATDLLQEESHVRLTEGEAKNYSESSRLTELAVTEVGSASTDKVLAFPESRLAGQTALSHPTLPFSLQVRQYLVNSRLAELKAGEAKEAAAATQGSGQRLAVKPAPPALKMDERNLPSAVVEVVTPQGSVGTWLVSLYLEGPQRFTAGGRTYELVLRSKRHYKPFSLQLMKFSHDKYQGTEIPKNFSSRVRVQNPRTGEDREVLIKMNSPLRYGGETFYQSGYDERDPRVTILQVVRNPGWLTPYLACVLVSLGLCWQFLSHLFGFVRERRAA